MEADCPYFMDDDMEKANLGKEHCSFKIMKVELS